MVDRLRLKGVVFFILSSAIGCGAFLPGSQLKLGLFGSRPAQHTETLNLAQRLLYSQQSVSAAVPARLARRRQVSMKAETDDKGEWINAGLLKRKGRRAPVQQVREPIVDVPSVSVGERAWGRFAGVSVMGYKGTTVARTSNQDAIYAGEIGERSSLFAVFDGHGEAGHEVSRYLAKHATEAFLPIATAMEQGGLEEEELDGMMQEAMEGLHRQVCEQPFDTTLSGSTAIVVLVTGEGEDERKLVVGNVGDCRCLLAWNGWGGKLTTSQLSVDQTPDRPDERKRIEENGGVVGMIDFAEDPSVVSVEEAGEAGVAYGPARVYFPENEWEPPYHTCFPGLAMSRSLGDSILDELGVLPVPEVTLRDVKPKDLFVVIASDGVWQVMSNEEVARTVEGSAGEARRACEAIYAEAASRWEKEETGPYRDDISSFVIYLQGSEVSADADADAEADAARASARAAR